MYQYYFIDIIILILLIYKTMDFTIIFLCIYIITSSLYSLVSLYFQQFSFPYIVLFGFYVPYICNICYIKSRVHILFLSHILPFSLLALGFSPLLLAPFLLSHNIYLNIDYTSERKHGSFFYLPSCI